MVRTCIILCIALVLIGDDVKSQPVKSLIDARATAETKALFANMDLLAGKGVMFGHQHATEYGRGWSGQENRSDVKSVTGSHPAVIGVDFMGLSGQPDADIEYNKKQLRKNIRDTYERGGITTVAWHFYNPLSNTKFYWNDSTAVAAVPRLKPGGDAHDVYKRILDGVGAFIQSVKSKDGKLIPMIFRPYHEMDGDWFWWGSRQSTPEEYKSLWQFTVSYLRDSLQVHSLIYAWSTDCKFNTEATYLERYPGDEWVDMVGMDNYHDFGRNGHYDVAAGIRKLQIVGEYAKKAGKLAAFTETGLESIPDDGWWTDTLLGAIKKSGSPFTYVLVWRNDQTDPKHYYAPYPGHRSVPDFMRFYHDPRTFFEKDLPDMYHQKQH